jgi:hypothetical protein
MVMADKFLIVFSFFMIDSNFVLTVSGMWYFAIAPSRMNVPQAVGRGIAILPWTHRTPHQFEVCHRCGVSKVFHVPLSAEMIGMFFLCRFYLRSKTAELTE